VTTIVSVFNRPSNSSTHLHFIYRLKCTYDGCGTSGTPNSTGTCVSQSFTRNTLAGDLVSFDASGVLNGGNALFNDPNAYDGSYSVGGSGARRGYLLVTNSTAGGRVDVGNSLSLGGEAILMDIAAGAAWGYRAVNDDLREDYNFNYTDDGGGVHNSLDFYSRWFSFFPPSEWTTRFFITPIGDLMNTANLSGTVRLDVTDPTANGVYDRGGTKYTFSREQNVTCTAAVNLTDLLDSTTLSAVQNTGGWAWFRNMTPATGSLLVYKLEYVFENPTYGGTNNNGYLLSSGDY